MLFGVNTKVQSFNFMCADSPWASLLSRKSDSSEGQMIIWWKEQQWEKENEYNHHFLVILERLGGNV